MEENSSRELFPLQSSPSEYVLPSTESPTSHMESHVLGFLDMNIPVATSTTPHLTALSEELSKKNGGEGEQVNEQIPSVAGFAPRTRSHSQGSSAVLSPETILRNSAKTFRNLPSIIRRRSSIDQE